MASSNLVERLATDTMDVLQQPKMKVEYIMIDALNPNEYNPNTHDPDSFDLLCKSLMYFGFTQPIVVHRPTMQIVDGEHRFRAASVIGYRSVPVVFVDFDEEKLKYATIMHNMARGHDNREMMDRLVNYLDTHFDNTTDKVLLKNREKYKL